MKSHDLCNLAVIFRCNSSDANHVSTLELITQAGLAFSYGVYRGTPERHTQKRRQMRNEIADALERKAQEAAR
jgi:hypothetical protein